MAKDDPRVEYRTDDWIVERRIIGFGGGRDAVMFCVFSARPGGKVFGMFERRVDATACVRGFEAIGWKADGDAKGGEWR